MLLWDSSNVVGCLMDCYGKILQGISCLVQSLKKWTCRQQDEHDETTKQLMVMENAMPIKVIGAMAKEKYHLDNHSCVSWYESSSLINC